MVRTTLFIFYLTMNGEHGNPLCFCGNETAIKSTQKAGPNQGREFYTCLNRTCKFFQWVPSSAPAAAAPPPHPDFFEPRGQFPSGNPPFRPPRTTTPTVASTWSSVVELIEKASYKIDILTTRIDHLEQLMSSKPVPAVAVSKKRKRTSSPSDGEPSDS
jgi:hypothetical protein